MTSQWPKLFIHFLQFHWLSCIFQCAGILISLLLFMQFEIKINWKNERLLKLFTQNVPLFFLAEIEAVPLQELVVLLFG